MVLGAAYMAIDFRNNELPVIIRILIVDSCFQSFLIAQPTFSIMLGYFSHDLSLSFGFLSLVRAAPIVPILYKPHKTRTSLHKLQPDGLVGSRSFLPPDLSRYKN